MIQVSKIPAKQDARKQHILKFLRSIGYSPRLVMFEPSESLARDEMRLDIRYASVVSPRCPDWRASPVTTYSNTQQTGFSCATVNNMGLMVADPRDLERGTPGELSPSSERNAIVLQGYRKNEPAGTGSSGDAPQATTTSQ